MTALWFVSFEVEEVINMQSLNDVLAVILAEQLFLEQPAKPGLK